MQAYSALIPAAFAILVNLAISLLMWAANCSGEPGATSSPCAVSVAFTSALPSTLTVSAFSRPMMALGVPAGASNPNHEVISKSGSPASGIVGTSGPRPRIDHDRLTQTYRELIADHAADHIRRAAGRLRDHDADRLARPGLRHDEARNQHADGESDPSLHNASLRKPRPDHKPASRSG